MLSLSTRAAVAFPVTLSVAGCSDPVGPPPSDPVGPAFSQNASASNKQKCATTPAAQQGAMNMVLNPGQGHHYDIGMGNAAEKGIDGMWKAVAASSCP